MKKISTSIMIVVLILLMSCSKDKAYATQTPSFTKISYWKGINGPAWSKWQNPDGTFFTDGVNSDIADIQYARIHWVRMRFKGGESYTQTIDPKVDAAINAGLNILFLYRKGTPELTYGTEAQEAANEAYLRSTLTRYKDRVKYWEIHIEPNLQFFWDIGNRDGEGSSNPDTLYNIGVRKYKQHMQRTYNAIKSEDLNAVVLLGGLSEYHLESFMDRLKIEGAYDFCDEVNVHPYSENPGTTQKVLNSLNAFKAKLREWPAPHNSKPIWVTEIGFHTESIWTSLGKVTTEEIKQHLLLFIS